MTADRNEPYEPAPDEPTRTEPITLTALSYNVHSSRGRDGRFSPGRIVEVVESTQSSIVGLQEVDARIGEPERFDQFSFFAEQLQMHCIAGPNITEHRGDYGNVNRLIQCW